MHELPQTFEELSDISLADLEALRLVLRGGSVIDWHRLNFASRAEIERFLRAQELDLSHPQDFARAETVKQSAVSYLRRKFDFPIPKAVAALDLPGLLELASKRGHRQLCACTILKVMHIIHHLEGRELLFMLPISDEEVFHLVEKKVYAAIGDALAANYPIVEFIGGRKNKDSLYTKLLSKPEVGAAQIYDKLRFRVVTSKAEDVFPVLNFLMRSLFPFNYVIPCQSTNSLFRFRAYCDSKPELRRWLPHLQLPLDIEADEDAGLVDNVFSSRAYRVVHFVTDMPVRLPDELLQGAPPAGWALGRVIFAQAEFQVLDQATDAQNEVGDASHAAYKERQRHAVMKRLKLGIAATRAEPAPGGDFADSESALVPIEDLVSEEFALESTQIDLDSLTNGDTDE